MFCKQNSTQIPSKLLLCVDFVDKISVIWLDTLIDCLLSKLLITNSVLNDVGYYLMKFICVVCIMLRILHFVDSRPNDETNRHLHDHTCNNIVITADGRGFMCIRYITIWSVLMYTYHLYQASIFVNDRLVLSLT